MSFKTHEYDLPKINQWDLNSLNGSRNTMWLKQQFYKDFLANKKGGKGLSLYKVSVEYL